MVVYHHSNSHRPIVHATLSTGRSDARCLEHHPRHISRVESQILEVPEEDLMDGKLGEDQKNPNSEKKKGTVAEHLSLFRDAESIHLHVECLWTLDHLVTQR